MLGREIEKKFSIKEIEYEVERIKKQAVKINSNSFMLSKELFDILGIPYFQAPVEAETTCADLCKRGFVDYVVSEDSDVLAYGAPFLITKINTSEDTCVIVNYSAILNSLEFTPEQFLDFCIMCGTDYNKNINIIIITNLHIKFLFTKFIINLLIKIVTYCLCILDIYNALMF